MATNMAPALPSAATALTLNRLFKSEKANCSPRHMEALRRVMSMFDLPLNGMDNLIEPLVRLGYRGRIIPVLPRWVSTQAILERAESERLYRVEAAHIHQFWHQLLAQEDGPKSLGAELVLTALNSPVDSILHTQGLTVWELGMIKSEFAKKNPTATLDTLGLRSLLTLLLIARIKEARPKSSSFLLNRGVLIIPSARLWVPDHTQGLGGAMKGVIFSSHGRLMLDAFLVRDWPEVGVGLTARVIQ